MHPCSESCAVRGEKIRVPHGVAREVLRAAASSSRTGLNPKHPGPSRGAGQASRSARSVFHVRGNASRSAPVTTALNRLLPLPGVIRSRSSGSGYGLAAPRQGPAPRPGPSRGPRSGLSPARVGVLLLCFAAAGVAVLLWALRAPALNRVEASFPELATGFRTAFNGSDPAVPHRVRSQAERLCDWSRARFPRIASGESSPRLFFLHTGEGPAYFDCGRGSWESVGFLSPVYLRTCVAGRDPCDSGVAGFATPDAA